MSGKQQTKKIILTALFLLCFAMPSWAQEDVFRHPLVPETMNAFTTICARLAEHQFITGNFEQEKTVKSLNRSIKSSGNFIIAVNMGIVWDTVKPFPSSLTLGRDYMIQSVPGGQRTVTSAQRNETFVRMAEIMSMIFSGNARGLLENFNIYYYGTTETWEIGLSPLDRSIQTFAQRFIIKGGSAIRYFQIIEQNGDTVSYVLSNHKYPAELGGNEKAFFIIP